MVERPVDLTELRVEAGDAVDQIGIVGIEREGALGPRDRLVPLSQFEQSVGAEVIGTRIVRVQLDLTLGIDQTPAVGLERLLAQTHSPVGEPLK